MIRNELQEQNIRLQSELDKERKINRRLIGVCKITIKNLDKEAGIPNEKIRMCIERALKEIAEE